MLTRYPDFNVFRLHYFIVMLRSWEIKKTPKKHWKQQDEKEEEKTPCERHYHNYANAKQTKGKPLLWLHMNPSAKLYPRTLGAHQGIFYQTNCVSMFTKKSKLLPGKNKSIQSKHLRTTNKLGAHRIEFICLGNSHCNFIWFRIHFIYRL